MRDWSKDFSAYRTQHYIRPVYATPPQPEQEQSGFFSREAMRAHSDFHVVQPEQEPVARVQFAGGLWKATLLTAVKKLDRSNIHALYITPQQRTWVGLTDEEIDDIAAFHGLDYRSYAPFTNAIEAKLKEKNT